MKKRLFRYITILTCFILSGFTYANEFEANSGDNNSESGITDKETIPFREFTNYYCEGTEWYYYSNMRMINEESTNYYIELLKWRTWLEGEYELDGKTYLGIHTHLITKESYPVIDGYARTENNKVWLKKRNTDEPEIMIFDFNLAPGESFTNYYNGNSEDTKHDITYTCLSNNKYYEEEMGGLPYMEIEWIERYPNMPLYGGGVPEFKETIQWIPGIGSVRGLDSPQDGTKTLYAVYSNGVPLFDNEPSIVEQLIEENNKTLLKGNKYHLDGREFKEGDRGISISRGKKVISN